MSFLRVPNWASASVLSLGASNFYNIMHNGLILAHGRSNLDHHVFCSCIKPALFTGFFLMTVKPVLYHSLLVIALQA